MKSITRHGGNNLFPSNRQILLITLSYKNFHGKHLIEFPLHSNWEFQFDKYSHVLIRPNEFLFNRPITNFLHRSAGVGN